MRTNRLDDEDLALLLDAKPEYLGWSSPEATLLCAPLGRTLLVDLVGQQLNALNTDPPVVVAPLPASADYRARLAAALPGATIVTSARELADVLMPAETSDLLLFVDPRCLPVAGGQLPLLLAGSETPRMARHLVAYAADPGGARESVNVDDEGLVHSVHRYYKPATWPFITGIAASLVPVSSGVLPLSAIPESLFDLRELLASRGVPSHDVAIEDGAFDLSDEHGLLAAMERSVRDETGAAGHDAGATVLVDAGHRIDPTARLLGPVIVQAGAQIEARCTIVGPAIIGPGARIAAGAVLAHVNVGPQAVVPAGRVLRDRVWFASAESSLDLAATAAAGRRTATFPQHLERHVVHAAEPQETTASHAGPSTSYLVVKRLLDIAIAVTALVLLSPLLLLLAALVWLDSRGPVFFRDPREGVGGRQFDCLKFRTMQVGASDLLRQLKGKDRLDGPH
ncbi:MAG: sugar transferase [Vicinamibacterales bacterium]